MSQSSEPTIVQSAKDFSQVARILMPKTTVLYIPESEIHREKETRKLWKENLPAIPGITKMHVATHDPKISSLQLHKSGSHYKWPRTKDNIFYQYENVVQKLSAPVVAGNRGQFTFKELMLAHLE
jgi:hypothetical protein